MFRYSNISLFGIFLICSLMLSSCDGRKSSHQALKESIADYKNSNSIEIDTYYPETPFVSQMDTILDSGYQIHIKTTSDPENEVVISQPKDTIQYHRHYRNFILNLELHDHQGLIIEEQFTKDRIDELIIDSRISAVDFKNQVLNAINVDYEKTTKKLIIIELRYKLPESEVITSFNLHLKPTGEFELRRS